MYKKEFDCWNLIKKDIDSKNKRPLFKERDIFWCKFVVNVGDEEDGKGQNFMRPVLILKKFNSRNFIGIPLSTAVKNNIFYHKINFKNKDQSLIISQIKFFDAKRITVRIGSLPSNDFKKVQEAVREMVL